MTISFESAAAAVGPNSDAFEGRHPNNTALSIKVAEPNVCGEAQDARGPARKSWVLQQHVALNWSYNSRIARFNKPLRADWPINEATSFVKSI
jgi:hypothetical protein